MFIDPKIVTFWAETAVSGVRNGLLLVNTTHLWQILLNILGLVVRVNEKVTTYTIYAQSIQ